MEAELRQILTTLGEPITHREVSFFYLLILESLLIGVKFTVGYSHERY